MNVAIVGAGYVGLPLAQVFAARHVLELFRAQAKAVARHVEDLGADIARRAMHANGKSDVDARVSGEQLLPRQNRFMFHVTSTSVGACGVHSACTGVPREHFDALG